MQRMEQVSEFKEKLVAVNRVTRSSRAAATSASLRWLWSAMKKAVWARHGQGR